MPLQPIACSKAAAALRAACHQAWALRLGARCKGPAALWRLMRGHNRGWYQPSTAAAAANTLRQWRRLQHLDDISNRFLRQGVHASRFLLFSCLLFSVCLLLFLFYRGSAGTSLSCAELTTLRSLSVYVLLAIYHNHNT